MHTVILYLADNRMVSSEHYDNRYYASEAYERFDVPSGHYIELRDRFGCLARRSAK